MGLVRLAFLLVLAAILYFTIAWLVGYALRPDSANATGHSDGDVLTPDSTHGAYRRRVMEIVRDRQRRIRELFASGNVDERATGTDRAIPKTRTGPR